MSTDPAAQGRSLAAYVQALVRCLGEADPAALARMIEVVAGRRARLALDGDVIVVAFDANGNLQVEADNPALIVDGSGSTTQTTVLDLLDGYVEVRDAVLSGRLEVFGSADSVGRIFIAIEILIDAAARVPSLQGLAREFLTEPHRVALRSKWSRRSPRTAKATSYEEYELLRRLALLPEVEAVPPPHRLTDRSRSGMI